MKEPLVDIIIPTFDNEKFLRPCIISLLRNRATPGLFRMLVVNNGHPNSCDYLKSEKDVKVIQAGKNLGWEGGIKLGLEHSKSKFVVFMNDDTHVPGTSRSWLNQLLQHFRDKKVGAVGPSSNVVMGWQNIFTDTPYQVFSSKFIIGFCAVLRRSAFDEVGGMDTSLPGGDDLDWSIRLREAGYKVLVDRTVFIFHHGFQTGNRVRGSSASANGWNSWEMHHKTTQALIKKHGMKKWWDCMKGAWEEPSVDILEDDLDAEGRVIRKLISKDDEIIYDIGCGGNKTLKELRV